MRQTWLLRSGEKRGRFSYRTSGGKAATPARVAQIDALAIPPAWRDVHIAASGRAAIQAWGFDARDRKQYRYHPNAVQRGQTRKYYRVRQMGRDLPAIRRVVYADFRRKRLGRAKVSAAIVRLLADGFFRIGNDRYAKENGTFGLTTLQKSHVKVDGDLVVFDYVGKRSIRHRQTVVSRELAKFIDSLLKVPGRRLFRYEDEEGQWHNIESVQINQYLQELAGFPYSAKDFRTWGGTLRAATVLADVGPARSMREAKGNVATAVRLVAAELGNTPAICRKSYVHPVVIERYLKHGDTIQLRSRSQRVHTTAGAHSAEERALIDFLDDHFPDRRKRRRAHPD
ncbi:MAG: DNA topoisomerase IB [Gemmatimonadaceae bacterium]